MTGKMSNLKRLSSSAVRFSTTERDRENEGEAGLVVSRTNSERNQASTEFCRSRAQSLNTRNVRIRFSTEAQRYVIPLRSQGSFKMKELRDLGAIGSLASSSASASASLSASASASASAAALASGVIGTHGVDNNNNNDADYSAVSEFFKRNLGKQEVRVAVLGAAGVGKTSIVEQFVANRFPIEHRTTTASRVYHPVILGTDRLFELKLSDCPPLQNFSPPAAVASASPRLAWTQYVGAGLRNASAYLLVYDVTSEQSFDFITHLRDEMLAHLDALAQKDSIGGTGSDSAPFASRRVPIVVVGNKHDLIVCPSPSPLVSGPASGSGSGPGPLVPGSIAAPGSILNPALRQKSSVITLSESETPIGSATDVAPEDAPDSMRARLSLGVRVLQRKAGNNRSVNSARSQSQSGDRDPKRYRSRSRLLQKLSSASNPASSLADGYAAIVTRNWKAVHLECSAKYNWNIGRIFEEIVKLVDEHQCEISRKNSRKHAVIRQRYTKCYVS